MLICTLISVFRQASALEREGVGLGMGTGEGGAGGAGWKGACGSSQQRQAGAKPACSGGLESNEAQQVQSMVKIHRDTGLWPLLVLGGPQSHVGSPSKKGRLQKPWIRQGAGTDKWSGVRVLGEMTGHHGHFGWTEWLLLPPPTPTPR